MGIELPQIGRYFLVLTHNLGTSFLYFGRFLVALFLNLGAYLSKAFVSNLRNVSGWVSLSSSFPNIMLFSITWALTLLILRFPPLWKSLLDSNKAIAIPAIIFKAVSFPLQFCSLSTFFDSAPISGSLSGTFISSSGKKFTTSVTCPQS